MVVNYKLRYEPLETEKIKRNKNPIKVILKAGYERNKRIFRGKNTTKVHCIICRRKEV